MGYPIIFDTQIIKLSNGKLLHLDRSGCNNDSHGRRLSEYTGKIYTYDEFQKYVDSFTENGIKNGILDGFDIILGSENATYYDYGKQLARKAKNAKTYEEFCAERWFSASSLDGVKIHESEAEFLTPKEFESYSRKLTGLNNEDEIINTLESNKHIYFYVDKKYKNIYV